MAADNWINLAIQLPVVGLFAYVVLSMLDKFIKYLGDQGQAQRDSLKIIASEYNASVREVSVATCVSVDKIVSKMTSDMDILSTKLNEMSVDHAEHDTYLRAITRVKYGNGAAEAAEKEADVAGTKASGRNI